MNLYKGILASIVLMTIACLTDQHAFAQQSQSSGTYRLEAGCRTYDIEYAITNGQIRSMDADPQISMMFLGIETSGNGKLVIKLPRELIGMTTEDGQDIDLEAFIDGVPSVTDALNSTGDYRAISIGFPNQSEEIEIVGISSPYYGPPSATLNVTAEGRAFPVYTQNAEVCMLEFLQEEKKLVIHSDGSAPIRISLPTELLGGPYTVLSDGEQAAFQTEHSGNSTTLAIDEAATTIEIIGTTAIPEFGSLTGLLLTVAGIAAVVITAKQVRR